MGLVYGLTLTLLNEMLLFAGQIAGVQFSFSMVNLLDPTSSIQTPLLGDLFQLMGTLVMIAAGLDRILLASMVRSFRVAPLGSFALAPQYGAGDCARRRAASFWPRSSWPRRCWRRPCWWRLPWRCWASSARSCR